MKFDYSFVDFDKTIFDCYKFEKDIWAVFERQGVKYEDYSATYKKSLCTISSDLFDYNFQEHIKFLQELGYKFGKEVETELGELLDKNNYLFPDTEEFLRFLRENTQKMVLLTAGDDEFQKIKIEKTKLGCWFDDVRVVLGHKEDFLADKIKPGDSVFFVNDSLRENLIIRDNFPEILIVTKFNSVRYTIAEAEKSGIPFFNTLKEIKNYVAGFK
ncbi:MAG: hypothetical protein HZC26_00615 [Candidatus Magasanikbacteria bacterium]|nr:hypothetical protein [Candidatus Magasanikbacteria bacterium]